MLSQAIQPNQPEYWVMERHDMLIQLVRNIKSNINSQVKLLDGSSHNKTVHVAKLKPY